MTSETFNKSLDAVGKLPAQDNANPNRTSENELRCIITSLVEAIKLYIKADDIDLTASAHPDSPLGKVLSAISDAEDVI